MGTSKENAMVHVLSLFPNTIDPSKLSDLSAKMIAAMQGADGLVSLEVSDGNIMSPAGPPAYAKVMEARFVSLEAFMAWVQTPEAQSGKEPMMSNGVVSIFYEVNEL